MEKFNLFLTYLSIGAVVIPTLILMVESFNKKYKIVRRDRNIIENKTTHNIKEKVTRKIKIAKNNGIIDIRMSKESA